MKKPVVFFSVSSKEYSKYAIPFWRSMVKFHDPKTIDMLWYTNETDPEVIKKLPAGIKMQDLTPLLNDPAFFFRQKPVLSEMLLNDYELVVGFDADMLILGDLNHIIDTQDYDIAAPYNFNRHDQQFYPLVEMGRIGIAPMEYFNCSLIAIRSKRFAHTWVVNCFSPQFDRMQYREQDILNIMCYFGNWNVRCLDLPFGMEKDGTPKFFGWHSLISKGELNRAKLRGNDIMVSKGLGDTPFPPNDVLLKAVSLGGGHGAIKDNWNAFFTPEVMERVNELTK